MPKQVFVKNKACLRKAKNQLEKHQMGFDGEYIGQRVLTEILGRKGVRLTSHKHTFDILTAREAWEVKTVGRGALHQMSVKAEQRVKKLLWAKAKKLKPKSMLVIVNDMAEVYIKSGIGKFRPGGMKKVKTYRNWRKEVGHGRLTRARQGIKKQLPIFRDDNLQGLYEAEMERYSKWDLKKFEQGFELEIGPQLSKSLDEWLVSTNQVDPMALKFKSETLEAVTGKVRVSSLELVRANKAKLLAKRYIEADDYVRLRALTQAYYKRTGKRTIKLWRGIDGNSGRKYQEQLKKLWNEANAQGTTWENFIEQTITIKEDAITGWTTDRRLAKAFGGDVDGILVERVVDVEDILVSDDIWYQGRFADEHEFLVKGGTREIKIGDIFFGAF